MKKAPMAAHGFFGLEEILLGGRPLPGSERAPQLRSLGLAAAWKRAVGEPLCAVTRPGGHSTGRLVVEVRDAAWKRELERLAPEILARLARLLPFERIDAIVFRVDAGAPRTPPPDGARVRSVRAPGETPALAGRLEELADQELSDRLRLVMGRYLAARAS